jgi:DNA-binding transcriptional LysR family regulator
MDLYNITFQQIEAFLTVGRYLNMSRAAESLYISQPTLSKALQRFENGIGFTVFNRNNKGVSLTPQGEYLLNAMESLYNNMEKAITTAKEMSTAESKKLRVVAPSSYDAVEDYSLLKQYLQDYAEKYPDVIVEKQLFDFRELQRQFEFGETDIAFTHSFALKKDEKVRFKYISEYTMHLAMSKKHPLAAYDTPQPDKLSEQTFYIVAQQDEAASKERLIRLCHKIGFTPKRIELLDNFPTLINVLRETSGVSICARFSLINPKDDIRYYPLRLDEETAYIVVAWYEDRLSRQARNFVKMLPDNPAQLRSDKK